jgi:hypothetical protein
MATRSGGPFFFRLRKLLHQSLISQIRRASLVVVECKYGPVDILDQRQILLRAKFTKFSKQ